MKQKLMTLLAIITLILLMPISAKANQIDENTTSTNLEETLKLAGMELKNENYKETDDQITIYMFRSSACEHAKAVLEYLNSISDEYGKYFKLRAYDVEQKENMDFYNEIADFVKQEMRGVPFYIIGETKYLGFNKEEQDVIAETIKKEYNKKNRYDVVKEMKKQNDKTSDKTEEKPTQKKSSITKKEIITIISLSLGLIILITAAIILNKKKISNKKIKIEDKLKEQRKEKKKKNFSKQGKDNKNDKTEEKNNKTKTKKNTTRKRSKKKSKEE